MQARNLATAGNLDDAWRTCEKYLIEDPNDQHALVLGSYIMQKLQKLPVAYHFARRLTELHPKDAAGWINYGQIANELWRFSEVERAYRQGLLVATDDESRHMLNVNLSAYHLDIGEFQKAERYALAAIGINPDSKKGRANLGFCYLANRKWKEGWEHYYYCLGTDWRKKVVYGDEPEWDGSPGKTVAVYGEQGIGDEIAFASMLPDAIRDCGRVIVDCDARNVGLFKRSFPLATIHGTKETEQLNWPLEDRGLDASIAMAQLGQFYRLKDEDFPAGPYLKPCPIRSGGWRRTFDQIAKPVIGIAWTGGIWRTGSKWRKTTLEDWLPLFRAVDAHWVCLQYRDARNELAEFKSQHGIEIHQYPWATLTRDYDDTAGLVAALDAVVSVPTAVVHLAAALGVPTVALKSERSCWKFHGNLAFHPDVKLVEWAGDWRKTIERAVPQVLEVREAA